jgi:ubiquinone/menaquinone biosynthesis C-methylase UbiE
VYETLGRLYNRLFLPRLVDFAMSRQDVARFRAAHVPAARGAVLEIGVGSGLNLPFYSSGVTRLCGVDRSAELLAIAKRRTADAPFPVDLINADAGWLPLRDASFDTVVVTWSLCSIANAAGAVREMRRVLKPAGTLIFVEHGLSPDGGVRRWQNRLTPLWRRCAGGCHLNRKMDDLVRQAGFTIVELRTAYAPGPRTLAFMYEGRAIKNQN